MESHRLDTGAQEPRAPRHLVRDAALGTTGGALASGALVGGTSGAIAGALSRAGYSREKSEFYGPAVERDGVLVAVDTEGAVSPEQTRETLARHGGSTYGR